MEKDLAKKSKKRVNELEKMREQEIKDRKERFDKEIKELTGKDPKTRKKPKAGTDEAKLDEIKEWALVNAENLKEFIKYGSNKVLDQIRIRNQASVIAREEIEKVKKKEGIDMKQAALTVAVVAIIGVMVFVVVTNFMDYNTLIKQLNEEKGKVGTVSGELAACQSELAAYKPGYVKPSSSEPPPDTVLEG